MINCRLLNTVLIFIICSLQLNGSILNQYHEIKNFISGNIEIENQNWGIYQHPTTGFIYFANSEGLIEYDGLTSTIYKLPFNKGARSVCIDNQGLIFTGGFEELGFWQKIRTANSNINR